MITQAMIENAILATINALIEFKSDTRSLVKARNLRNARDHLIALFSANLEEGVLQNPPRNQDLVDKDSKERNWSALFKSLWRTRTLQNILEEYKLLMECEEEIANLIGGSDVVKTRATGPTQGLNRTVTHPIRYEDTMRIATHSNQSSIIRGTTLRGKRRNSPVSDNDTDYRVVDAIMAGVHSNENGSRDFIFGGVADGQGGHAGDSEEDINIETAASKAIETASLLFSTFKSATELKNEMPEVVNVIVRHIKKVSDKNTCLSAFRTFPNGDGSHQVVGVNIGDSMVISYNPFTRTCRTLASARLEQNYRTLFFPQNRSTTSEITFEARIEEGEIVIALTDGIWENLPHSSDAAHTIQNIDSNRLSQMLSVLPSFVSTQQLAQQITNLALQEAENNRQSLIEGAPKNIAIKEEMKQLESLLDNEQKHPFYEAMGDADAHLMIKNGRDPKVRLEKIQWFENMEKKFFPQSHDTRLEEVFNKKPVNENEFIKIYKEKVAKFEAQIYKPYGPRIYATTHYDNLSRSLIDSGDDISLVVMQAPIRALELLRAAALNPNRRVEFIMQTRDYLLKNQLYTRTYIDGLFQLLSIDSKQEVVLILKASLLEVPLSFTPLLTQKVTSNANAASTSSTTPSCSSSSARHKI